MKPVVQIENAEVRTMYAYADGEPGLQTVNILVGNVIGHPRHGDGTAVFSSPIIGKNENNEVETEHSLYSVISWKKKAA